MSRIFALIYYAIIVNASFKIGACEPSSLSYDIEPLSYDLKITPDLKTFTFKGKVSIDINVKFTTEVVKLHCKNLRLKETKLFEKDTFTPLSIRPNHTNDFCIIHASKRLKYDTEYTLSIEFESDLNENAKGLYKASYAENGEKKWLIATHLHGIHAREVFPCFDEPRYRTPFTISMARNAHQNALSNMPLTGSHAYTSSDQDLVWSSFEKSPPIPTHLVAFMVTEYSFISEKSNIIKIWTRQTITRYARYALTQGEKILKSLEDFIGVSPKLSKLDIVVIPQYEPKLMENWGLHVFDEKFLISDEKKASQLQNTIVTASMCHQMARHWFRGLVTPVSWDYAWLTEAFAGYMEFLVTPMVDNAFETDKIFIVEILQPALRNELTNARALTSPITTESQIDENFGLINYHKGTSIIRMLEHIISKNSLRSVIHNYLIEGQKSHNGLVTPKNLFEALQNQFNIDSFPLPPHVTIVDVMRTWTENIGYPIINVTRDYRHKTIDIKQGTFQSPQASSPIPDQKWIVPITYTTKYNPTDSFSRTKPNEWLLPNEEMKLSLNIENTDWIICNLQQTGYYRVNYDTNNWNLLTIQLQEDLQKIHFLNRAQLVDDSFTLVSEDLLSYEIPFKLADYLQNETSIVPLLSAIFHFNTLYKKYEDTTLRVFLCMYIKRTLERYIQQNGFNIKPTDDYLTKMGKPSLLLLACKLGLPGCIQGALQEYNSSIADLSKVQPDLKEVIYCTALREVQDSESVYNNLWSIYQASDIAYEKITILKTLGCSHSENLLKKFLSKLFDQKDETIARQDKNYLITSILSSFNGITVTLKFIRERIQQIPQMNNTDLEIFVKILKKLELEVHSTRHTRLLKIIVKESGNLNNTKFSGCVESLQRVLSLGLKRSKENYKRSMKLQPILRDILKIPSMNTSMPDSNRSSSVASVPSTVMFFVSFCFIIHLYELVFQ